MPKEVMLTQNTPEWLKFRQWRIGASDAPIIMGVSPYKSKLMLWEEKILGTVTQSNYAMERGHRLEQKARDWVNARHGDFGLKYRPAVLQHDSIDWMIASLDGWKAGYGNTIHFTKGLEIKCNGSETHRKSINGEVVEWHLCQLMHQMVVADLKEILYVSFDGEEGVEILVKRDDEYITKKLMPALASFYQSLVDFKPPEPSDKDLIEITNLDALNMAREYSETLMQIKRLEEKLEPLKEELCGYATHGRCKIGELKVTKVMKRGNIDYQKFIKDKDLKVPDSYRKENTVSWRITQS